MEAINQEAYDRGVEMGTAVLAGESKYYNPYKRGSVQYFSFEKGFNDYNY